MTLPQRMSGPVSLPDAPADSLSAAACEQFLVHEARLLDEGRFDEWLALFTADAWYWVPSEPNQANPRDTVSLTEMGCTTRSCWNWLMNERLG